MQNEKEIRYIDLFGGVGGFRLGIEKAQKERDKRISGDGPNINREQRSQGRSKCPNDNSTCRQPKQDQNTEDKSNSKGTKSFRQYPTFTCVLYNDIDKYAVQTYNKNFGENYEAKDIRTIKTSEIPDFDFLCAGFPCQAFSIAGKRRGFQDTRGTLFFEIARIVKAKRPKIILLENVKGLLNHDKGQTFSIILQTLDELGYEVQWMVLNSKFFGVPQNRERVFIIGNKRRESRSEILPFRESNKEFNRRDAEKQVASSLQHPGHSGGNYRGMNMIYEKLGKVYGNKDVAQAHRAYSPEGIMSSQRGNTRSLIIENVRAVLTPDRENKRQHGRRFKKNEEPMFTLTGIDIHGIAYLEDSGGLRWVIRRLTPLECERLQGFPDNWTEGVSETQRYKQMGNAVTVNVVQGIVERMFK